MCENKITAGKPSVSIIMPVYNMSKYISEAIESVIAQIYTDYELIIVDDGSSDDSKDVINKYIDKFKTINIKYIYQNNKGLACARNTAIKYSQGEYLALLDPDDSWFPERLRDGVSILNNHPEVGLVHSNIIIIDENNKTLEIPDRNVSILSGDIYRAILLRKGHISCPTVLFRRECIFKVGNFDEYLTYLGCEDRDLWLRIAKHYKVYFINKELASYRKVSGSMSSNFEKMYIARKYVVEKNIKDSTNIFLKRQSLSAIHKEMGFYFLSNKQHKTALIEFVNSIKYWPFDIETIYGTVKSLLKV